MNIWQSLIHNAQAQQWIAAVLAVLLASILLILWVARKMQEQAERDQYEQYFKRLDDAGPTRPKK
jgi:di/tricarboxylate transporter